MELREHIKTEEEKEEREKTEAHNYFFVHPQYEFLKLFFDYHPLQETNDLHSLRKYSTKIA